MWLKRTEISDGRRDLRWERAFKWLIAYLVGKRYSPEDQNCWLRLKDGGHETTTISSPRNAISLLRGASAHPVRYIRAASTRRQGVRSCKYFLAKIEIWGQVSGIYRRGSQFSASAWIGISQWKSYLHPRSLHGNFNCAIHRGLRENGSRRL